MKNLLVLFLFMTPLCGLADVVVPVDKVENSVNIRLSPDATSDVVGRLDQGSSAELVNSIEGWHEVELEGGSTGFISSDWSRLVSNDDVVAEAEVAEVVAEAVVVEGVEELVEDVVEEELVIVVEEELEEVVEEVVEDVIVEETVEVVVEEVEEAVVIEEIEVEVIAEDSVVEEEAVVPDPVVVEVVKDKKRDEVELKGTKGFLVRFRDKTEGGNSQIYDDGNQIGIGTTSPKQRLEVNGSIQIHEQNSSVAGLMITQSSGDMGYIMHNRASTLTIGAGSIDRITIDRDGNVGMGVSRPDHPLEMASGAHVTAGGVWTNSSSRDKKENIEFLQADAATSALMSLQPVLFNYRNEVDEEYVGFIAEDVPDLVAVGDREALSSMDIVAVLTKVVQEQQKKIKELEQRLDAM